MGGRKEAGNVLKQQPAGGQFAGQPHELEEEARAFAVESGSLPSEGDVLTGEASAEEAGCPSSSTLPERVGLNTTHIAPPGHVGPVALQDSLAEGIDFDLADALPAGSLKAKVKPSYPSKDTHKP